MPYTRTHAHLHVVYVCVCVCMYVCADLNQHSICPALSARAFVTHEIILRACACACARTLLQIVATSYPICGLPSCVVTSSAFGCAMSLAAVCVCSRARVFVRPCVCVRARVCVCVRACVRVSNDIIEDRSACRSEAVFIQSCSNPSLFLY